MSLEGSPKPSGKETFEAAHGAKNAEQLAQTKREQELFDEKWEETGKIKIGEQELKTYHVSPENPESETPTLVVPGWSATPEVVKENMRAIVAEGIEAVAVEAPHGSEHSIEAPEHVGEVADAELRRIASFMSMLDASKIEKTDAIGHSEGGLDVLLAAAMYPERFNTVVLVNPAGMIENFNLGKLMAGFALDGIRSNYFAKKQGTVAEKKRQDALSIPNMFSEPLHSLKEINSMAKSKAYELLRFVTEAGVDIIIVHGPEDTVFPFKDMAATIENQKENESEDITKLLKGVYSVAGDHNSFVRNAATYTRLATGAIKARAMQKN